MQDRPAERLARYSETKSGGGISTMTSITVDMDSVLVTTQIGNHRGDDRAKISSLWKTDSLLLLVPPSRVINSNLTDRVILVTGYNGCYTPTRWQARDA
jgi:hypothetical protein